MKADFKATTWELEALWPDSEVTLEEFPSGAAMYSVVLAAKLFVLEYRPGHGYGVSLVPDGPEAWISGHNFVTQDFEAAKDHLLELIRENTSVPTALARMAA